MEKGQMAEKGGEVLDRTTSFSVGAVTPTEANDVGEPDKNRIPELHRTFKARHIQMICLGESRSTSIVKCGVLIARM